MGVVDVLAGERGRVGGVASAEAPLTAESARFDKGTQTFVEIRGDADRRVVTAVELLSPTNKVDPGRELLATKRRSWLASEAHLLEIDLLRAGRRFPTARALPAAPDFVILSRAARL